MASISATFRAKTNFMKTWRPRSPPSNRDRLELYALHKQSISGDAPIDNDNLVMSVAEKAKLSAWRTKRGMSREEAMSRYGEECDRQLRVYGTAVAPGTAAAQGGGAGGTPAGTYSAPSRMQHTGKQMQQQQQQQQQSYHQQSQQQQHSQQAAASTSEQTTGTGSTTPSTPQNTPANNNTEEEEEGRGVLLCPRGLAAIPLLCAAASESRSAYLARLQVTHPTNGWWAKQEPLCLEINNPLSLPEKLVLCLATQVEQLSLIVSEYMGEGHAVSIMSPRVFQAFLWPVHNVFLCCWIALILTTTYLGSMVTMCQTLLFGAKRTNAPLGRLFVEEIHPSARAVESLCEEHQVIGVRVAGLALMPLMMLCDVATSVVGRVGMLVGSLVFVITGVCSWWYWLWVLPWLALCGVCLAVMSGWCFGIIELAGN